MLSLVRRGSPDACIFEHAHHLRGPEGALLTLASHPGWAVVPRYEYPRSAEEWRYIELGLGPSRMAAHMQLQGEFLVRLHDERVMDIAHWKYEEGNTLNVLRSARCHPGHTRYGNGGRSFVVNADGTISPKLATHLVLGAGKPRFVFVPSSSPNVCVFERAQELIRGDAPVPLALASHPGLAVVQSFDEPREAYEEWHYKELAIGPADRAVVASRQGAHLVDTQGWYVTPSMLNVHHGNHTDLVRHRFNHPARLLEEHGKHGSKRPLDLHFHPDGTVSPASQPQLRLGCEFPPLSLGQGPPPVAEVAAQAELPLGMPVERPVSVMAMPVVVNAVAVDTTYQPIAGAASSSAAAAPTLSEMVAIFKAQLGIDEATPMAEAVDRACRELGLPEKGPLVERATQCWHALGAPPPPKRV